MIVPSTLHAVLAARLDQARAGGAAACSSEAAIEGEVFHRGAVQALSPDERPVTPVLAALVRKELIRPDRTQLAGDDGFRFRHMLIRDAAYDALPKASPHRAPRALRDLARGARHRSSSSSTRSSAITSSRGLATVPSSDYLPTPRWPRRRGAA